MDTVDLFWIEKPKHFGEISGFGNSVSWTWLLRVDIISVWNMFMPGNDGSDEAKAILAFCQVIDQTLFINNKMLWKAAVTLLDRPDEPGRIARKFGLFKPNNPNRPSVTKALYQLIKKKLTGYLQLQAAKTSHLIPDSRLPKCSSARLQVAAESR